MIGTGEGKKYPAVTVITGLLVAILFAVIKIKTHDRFLLFDRLYPGAGWLQGIILSVYAAFVASRMARPGESAKWRLRIWILFSVVFFLQLFLGLLVSDIFLMTGKLHVPVPAVIVAGPVYRGSGFFMPILLGATLLLVGPAWCSHLCYVGAWDNAASLSKKIPLQGSRYRHLFRFIILAAVILTAILLRLSGAEPVTAAIAALLFGGTGVILMVLISRRKGIMAHCLYWCPIGLVTAFLGRISPFRITIGNACTACGACARVCRYDALGLDAIRQQKVETSCTLCGDCIAACSSGQIEYRYGPFRGEKARLLFVVVITVLHGIFMGVARL